MPEGMKFDSEKPRAGLVLGGFSTALLEVSKVGTFGAKKYAPNNWKLVNPERYIDALFRHLFQWMGSDPNDSETGISHLAHATWNALAILQLTTTTEEGKKCIEEKIEQLKLPLEFEGDCQPEETRYTFGSRQE